MTEGAKNDGVPARPVIIPQFSKREEKSIGGPARKITRRMSDEEVQDKLGEAANAGPWLVALWYVDVPAGGDPLPLRCFTKTSGTFPDGDCPKAVLMLEEHLAERIKRAHVAAREKERGFAAE